jgi:sterol desaturase/sphingolipid hydroxylase (fatty acid hydroxylase superfamily)
MQKPHKSVRVFKNSFMERLTHVHPLTPLMVWGPIILWLLWDSLITLELNPWQVGGLGLAAILSWSLTEYLLHRFIFHLEMDTPLGERFHFLVHGLHHVDPIDPTRLVMPPALSIILGILFYNLFYFIFGPLWVEPFFAFFLVGYLCYDYIHFAVHHFQPRTKIGKMLRHSHMQHHYVSPHARWGVSSPLWDYVFGSLEDTKKNEQTA